MKIGLIDVDGHNFPNLALMRISAYHKAKGDTVEWWSSEFEYYDVVYMSKVFSDAYTKEGHTPMNCGKVIKGGTGYCIKLGKDGKEYFDKSKNHTLPGEVEKMFPDYSIYPQYDFAVSMTSRGCPRGCGFCHVAPKEGRCSVKVADVKDFWNGQKEIKVLDPNITACRDKRDLLEQYVSTGAWIDFTQGIDIRLVNDADIDALNRMKIKLVHFAWDNPKDDLRERFVYFSKHFRDLRIIGQVKREKRIGKCTGSKHYSEVYNGKVQLPDHDQNSQQRRSCRIWHDRQGEARYPGLDEFLPREQVLRR